MGEPSQLSLIALRSQVQKQHPGMQVAIDPIDKSVLVYTLHGSGRTEEEAFQNALTSHHTNFNRGKALRGMLNDILADLKTPGMSRERHDNIHDSLSICESYLNCGILAGSIPFIEVPSFTREIEDLQRRVTARLGMSAQQAADYNKAKTHAAAPVTSLSQQGQWQDLATRFGFNPK